MGKERKGSIVERDGKLYVRVGYKDSNGKYRELMRRAQDRADAKRIAKQLVAELEQSNREQIIEGSRMTFFDLASIFTESRLTAPEYQGERKIAGMRSWKRQLSFLKPLVEQFGKRLIRDVAPKELEAYKLMRLRMPTMRGSGVRDIVGVNRELSLMRSMLNYAKRQGWLSVNPFERCVAIISPSDEVKRDRVLSREEEGRLLTVCVDKREHQRPLIIAALDTGLRRGELFSLTWLDVGLSTRTIRLRAFNTKTAKAREVPISERLAMELQRLRLASSGGGLIFTCGGVKRSFTTACRLAGINDLHFHDLRHTFATRMVQAGMPIAEVARLLGHSSLQMTYRYSNATAETISRAATLLNQMNEVHSRDGQGGGEGQGEGYIN